MLIPAYTPMRKRPDGKWEPVPANENDSGNWCLATDLDTDKPPQSFVVVTPPLPVSSELRPDHCNCLQLAWDELLGSLRIPKHILEAAAGSSKAEAEMFRR